MAGLDPKKAKANLAIVKVALRKAAMKGKDGNPARVGFAFAPGKDKSEHILVIDPRKRAQALMQQIAKEHKDHKALCCGTATVIKEGGKLTLAIKYVKKLAGAERKMQEALRHMTLQYLVKLEKEEEDEDIEENLDEEIDEKLSEAEELEEKLDARHEADASADGDDDEDDEDDDDEDEDEDSDDEEPRAMREEDEEVRRHAQGEESEKPKTAAGAPAKPAAAPAPAALDKVKALGQAPQVWHQTRSVITGSIEKLRAAIKKEYAAEAPELNAEVDKGIAQMNRIMERLDHRLAEQLEKAHKAKDEAARKAELAKAKALLTEHIKYIQTEPLVAHIDANPFGVQTNLKKTLMASFTHVAKVIS